LECGADQGISRAILYIRLDISVRYAVDRVFVIGLADNSPQWYRNYLGLQSGYLANSEVGAA